MKRTPRTSGLQNLMVFILRNPRAFGRFHFIGLSRRTGRTAFFVAILLSNTIAFSQTGTITGRVRFGNEPLEAATVSLGQKTKLTDHNGEFSFSAQAGHYKLIITHAGFRRVERLVILEAGSTKSFEFDLVANEQLGEIVVLGSRSNVQRSNLNTTVPVDAFSSAQLIETGQTSPMQMLLFTAPSVNASLQFYSEPISLRGLDPDQTLILLNGTRYSNMAYINTGIPRGQLGKGGAGNDLSTIPFSAIEKIEILRDGASAQYGSDAIAGVVNIILKESTHKTSVKLQVGQQYKGDGERINLGIYHGIDLNKRGFLSFSGDFDYRGPTYRRGEYLGTVYYDTAGKTPREQDRLLALDSQKIKDRGFDRNDVSHSGTTKLINFGILVTGAYHVKKKTELFWTGALNNNLLTYVQPHTLPRNNRAVNTELYPDGFRAIVKPNRWNASVIAGARGVTGKGIHWEYSSAYGMNTYRYKSENTNNASQQYTLGKNAPTRFYTGSSTYHQLTNTIHFSKNFSDPRNRLMNFNLSLGAELRIEKYRTKAGDSASWNNYDPSLNKFGGAQNSRVFSPADVVNKNRYVPSAYIDYESNFSSRFLLDLASRFEYYSDFGGNFAGKLAARFKLFDKLTLRGSISNGFRAPSLQQTYFSAITGGFANIGGIRKSTTTGIFNHDHPVTKLFGVPSLEAEKSINLSGGLTSTLTSCISLTIDAYWIQIKNRVILSGGLGRSNPEVDSLLNDPSLRNYSYIDQVSFFANAINTRTQGVDGVIHGRWNFHKSQLMAVMSANFTRTRLFGDIRTATNLSATAENKNALFNEEQRTDLENGQPRSKIILNLNFKRNKIGFILRNTRFGETAFQYTGFPKETFSPKVLTDIMFSYTPKYWLTITSGANNVFNVYPDRVENFDNTMQGRFPYGLDAWQFGFLGGYYYVSMGLNL